MNTDMLRTLALLVPVLLVSCADPNVNTGAPSPANKTSPPPSAGISPVEELFNPAAINELNAQNCVASPWTDASGNPISVDQKFGDGSAAVTRCLAETDAIKVLYQVNTFCEDVACTKPYALGNVLNQITDLEVTHGIKASQYEIVLVIHAGGWNMVLDPAKGHPDAASNIFSAKVAGLVKRPNVKVLFCQNTASANKITLDQMIAGIGFVTSGVSAITDLQEVGYQYVQP